MKGQERRIKYLMSKLPKQEYRKDNQNPVTNTRKFGSGGGNGGWL
jgi:hypothetical protein